MLGCFESIGVRRTPQSVRFFLYNRFFTSPGSPTSFYPNTRTVAQPHGSRTRCLRRLPKRHTGSPFSTFSFPLFLSLLQISTMPRQSFDSTTSHPGTATRRASAPPPYLLHVPSYDPSTAHFSLEDRLYHERYLKTCSRLDHIIEAATRHNPRFTNPFKPNFDVEPPSEAEKKVLSEWREELLSKLADSVDFRWNYVNPKNYRLIDEKLTELSGNAQKLVSTLEVKSFLFECLSDSLTNCITAGT